MMRISFESSKIYLQKHDESILESNSSFFLLSGNDWQNGEMLLRKVVCVFKLIRGDLQRDD